MVARYDKITSVLPSYLRVRFRSRRRNNAPGTRLSVSVYYTYVYAVRVYIYIYIRERRATFGDRTVAINPTGPIQISFRSYEPDGRTTVRGPKHIFSPGPVLFCRARIAATRTPLYSLRVPRARNVDEFAYVPKTGFSIPFRPSKFVTKNRRPSEMVGHECSVWTAP